MSGPVTTDREFRRFMQSVRRRVRLDVAETREPPPLTLWVSDGANPRRVSGVHVGAARDGADVRMRIRESVVAAGSSWAAVGRGLFTVDELVPTTAFGLVCCSMFEAVVFSTDIRAGELGVWAHAAFDTSELEPLLQASLRSVPR